MTTTETIQQLNRELGDKVLEDAKQNPQAYPGRLVGIANGKVVVITDDLNEFVRQLKQVEPDPTRTYGVDISCDYTKVYEIWGV